MPIDVQEAHGVSPCVDAMLGESATKVDGSAVACEPCQFAAQRFDLGSTVEAKQAAEALKLTAKDLLDLGVVDAVIPEPLGGAHRDPQSIYMAIGAELEHAIYKMDGIDGGQLRAKRRKKFMELGEKGLV